MTAPPDRPPARTPDRSPDRSPDRAPTPAQTPAFGVPFLPLRGLEAAGGRFVSRTRLAMGALYGFREDDLIDGIKAFNPLDVLDSALTAWKEGAFQLNTWTV